ncbi:MAG: thioredoxin [Lachnospiraceae bacterium]|nr:thioredoxin [Lachnospiraceae bacterium]MBP5255126.1 thioredoxin [Lachnospiraceae bacterium]
MNEKIFTEENFEEEVLKSELPVLVDFFATWCGPCKMMAPLIASFADEQAGKVKVGKVDIDENMSLVSTYGISAVPTLIAFKDGKVIGTKLGYTPKEELEALFA